MVNPANPDFTSYEVHEVTPENVGQLPADDGFEAYDKLWRPVGFIINNRSPFPHINGDLSLLAMSENGRYTNLPVEKVPHLSHHSDDVRGRLLGHMVSLRHFKSQAPETGGPAAQENYLRILSIMGATALGPLSSQEARFWYGEHPDHPDGRGFFLGALHIGMSDNTGQSSGYYLPDEIAYKHFAIARS